VTNSATKYVQGDPKKNATDELSINRKPTNEISLLRQIKLSNKHYNIIT